VDVAAEKEEGAVGTVEQQAVPGEMQDPTAPPPEEEAKVQEMAEAEEKSAPATPPTETQS
jgi:hypothetical protein